MERLAIAFAALAGFAAVALDAYAAHGLAASPERAALAGLAARYALVHAVALIGLALLMRGAGRRFWLAASAWCFAGGIVLFSGGLAAHALGHPAGPVVPVGGTLFLAGWAALFVHALRGS